MDVDLQTDMEEYFLENTDMLPADQAIELGFFMMDPYSGKVMTVIGSRYERSGRLLYNNATQATRQPGSSIKPVGPYSWASTRAPSPTALCSTTSPSPATTARAARRRDPPTTAWTTPAA